MQDSLAALFNVAASGAKSRQWAYYIALRRAIGRSLPGENRAVVELNSGFDN
jgi:hypothetical protein